MWCINPNLDILTVEMKQYAFQSDLPRSRQQLSNFRSLVANPLINMSRVFAVVSLGPKPSQGRVGRHRDVTTGPL